MARKPVTDISAFASLTLEGNLISPAMVAAIDRREATEQSEADYGIRKGLNLRDEISLAFRVGQAHYDAFAKQATPSASGTARFVREFLSETFGFNDLKDAQLPLAYMAGEGRVPIVVVPHADALDRASTTLSTDRRRSAAFALQDWLNEREDALWGLATNGTTLRLLRDNASLTRPAYIEADLSQIFETEDVASFAVLWLIIHRSRFGKAGSPTADCALEHWRDAGAKEGEVAREKLSAQVEEALKLLGSGFLEANPDLRQRIASGHLPLTEWFNELLRLVYRLIFLMVAEDRNLLHTPDAAAEARRLYLEGYSLAHLRANAVRRSSWDRHHDRFEGLKIVFKALTQGQSLLGLPPLGGLFSAHQLPELETVQISNRAFMAALYRLSWLTHDGAVVPVNWRAMETEELGSVYESLLELQPQISPDGRQLLFAHEAAEKKGNQRKTTGSYYTPDSLVQALLDTALDPVLDKTEAEAKDPVKALLSLAIIDPACGSGHFLLAAARRIATRVARHRSTGTPSVTDYRHALRDVARSCLHGVDRNPMAVELTKVALWIETVDPGLPLGFFDAQIRCGDALLGVFDLNVLQDGIPDAAYKPLTGDDKDTAKYYLQANREARTGQGGFDFGTGKSAMPEMKPLALDFSGFRDLPEDTVEQIGAKAVRYNELSESEAFVRATAAADLYVAAFLQPKVGGAAAGASSRIVPTTEDVWAALHRRKVRSTMSEAPKAARRARALHWPLEFPDIMHRGGFDVVLGNPPWERIKVQEHEYFASRDPEIGSEKSAKVRSLLISALRNAPLESSERNLYSQFESARREAEAISTFMLLPGEDGGRFPFCGRGDVNTYALFSELFNNLKRHDGRAGIIVPTGIATDALTAPFFGYLVDERRLACLVDFENSGPIFPTVHRSFKFCLLTLGRNEPMASFAYFIKETPQLTEPERCFTLTPEQIATINPNTKTAPVFRSRADAELTLKIYQNNPILIEKGAGVSHNPWVVSHASTLFDMTRDSGFFNSQRDLQTRSLSLEGNAWFSSESGSVAFLPLFEAKMLHIFDHRWAPSPDEDQGNEGGFARSKADPDYEPLPRFWVPIEEITKRIEKQGWKFKWLIGIRKIARVTDERTIIPTIFPLGAVGNSEHVIFPGAHLPVGQVVYFVGAASSLVLDYVARQKIGGTNINFFYLEQLPFPPPGQASDVMMEFICPRVLELTFTSLSLTPFARDLGYDGPPFAWDEFRRACLRADLDAFYARAYGLTRDELRYILDPTDVKGPDYPSETFRVLKEKEIRQHGEYRTRRLVLAAWDRMDAIGEFTAMGM